MTHKMSKEEKDQLTSRTVVEGLFSEDSKIKKQASDKAEEYMRLYHYENGLYRALFDPKVYTGSYDKQLDVEGPAIIFGIQPDVPRVISIPFGTSTEAYEFFGRKGRVTFDAIQSFKFRKDKRLLLNEPGDIRTWITDKTVFMTHEEEDSRLFGAVDWVLANGPDDPTDLQPNRVLPGLDRPSWTTLSGGWVRETFVECLKVLPNTRQRTTMGQAFRPHTIIINDNLGHEMLKWTDDQISQQLLEEIDNQGWVRTSFMNKEILITGKKHLIGDDEVYIIGPRDQAARTHLLSDIRLHTKAEVNMLEWLSEETLGMTINPYSWAKVTLV